MWNVHLKHETTKSAQNYQICDKMSCNTKMLALYDKIDISAKFPLENILNLHLYENCFSNVVFDEISMNFVPTKLVLL